MNLKGLSKKSRARLVTLLAIGLSLVLVGITQAGSYTSSWGNWAGSWADRPDEGQHQWYNYSTSVSWWSYYRWVGSGPNSGRRIELEFYNPTNGNHCNRLAPTFFEAYGGDWVDDWWTSNECGGWGSAHERITIDILETNVVPGHSYFVNAKADILYSASYGGEVNVSYTCWFCSDDWLGKVVYDAGYNGTSSTP